MSISSIGYPQPAKVVGAVGSLLAVGSTLVTAALDGYQFVAKNVDGTNFEFGIIAVAAHACNHTTQVYTGTNTLTLHNGSVTLVAATYTTVATGLLLGGGLSSHISVGPTGIHIFNVYVSLPISASATNVHIWAEEIS